MNASAQSRTAGSCPHACVRLMGRKRFIGVDRFLGPPTPVGERLRAPAGTREPFSNASLLRTRRSLSNARDLGRRGALGPMSLHHVETLALWRLPIERRQNIMWHPRMMVPASCEGPPSLLRREFRGISRKGVRQARRRTPQTGFAGKEKSCQFSASWSGCSQASGKRCRASGGHGRSRGLSGICNAFGMASRILSRKNLKQKRGWQGRIKRRSQESDPPLPSR